jgi:hypothetical protein
MKPWAILWKDTFIALEGRTKDAEQRCAEAEAKAAQLDELRRAVTDKQRELHRPLFARTSHFRAKDAQGTAQRAMTAPDDHTLHAMAHWQSSCKPDTVARRRHEDEVRRFEDRAKLAEAWAMAVRDYPGIAC